MTELAYNLITFCSEPKADKPKSGKKFHHQSSKEKMAATRYVRM